MIGIIATSIRVVWALVDGLLILSRGGNDPYGLRRESNHASGGADKYSARIWDVASCLEVIGIVCGLFGFGRMQLSNNVLAWFGLTVMIIGIAIRWSAIRTLGKYFSGKVAIQPGHQLIRDGLHKYVRHPSYTGLLLAHLGLGLSFVNWFTLGFSVIPFVVAVWYRMRVEDAALQTAFGVVYLDYSKHAKRLIPKLY